MTVYTIKYKTILFIMTLIFFTVLVPSVNSESHVEKVSPVLKTETHKNKTPLNRSATFKPHSNPESYSIPSKNQQDFVPSEKIKADSSVSFPVDI